MDLAQLQFFIGGGVVGATVKTLADHVSKVRLERSAAVRPKDMERIDAARNYCRSLFKHEVAQVIALTYNDDPDYFLPSDFEHYDEAEQVIQDLDDRKLDTRWAAYLSTVRVFSDKYPAPIAEPHRRELWGVPIGGVGVHVRGTLWPRSEKLKVYRKASLKVQWVPP